MKRGIFTQWVFGILSIVSVPFSACQNIEVEKTASTHTPPGKNLQIDKKDVSGDETVIPATNPSAPTISTITFPARIRSAGGYGLGEVKFTDADGDVHSAQFTLVDGGCMEFEYFALNPMDYLRSGDRFNGAFQFQQSCRKCVGSDGDLIRMRVQLYDRSGNESEAVDYHFTCE